MSLWIYLFKIKKIAILNVKGVDYGYILWGINKNKAVSILNNSALEDEGVLEIGFGANKTSIEVIKEGAFGGTYFRDIDSSVNGKWYKKSWKEFDQLKDIDQKFYCSDYYDRSVNKYGVKCGTWLRSWENKGWINKIDPYDWFQWCFRYWLGRRSKDNERQINWWKRVVSRFRDKLVKMNKDTGSKFDDYSISPKIREI